MNVSFRPLSVPLTHPFRIATGEVRAIGNAVVRIDADGVEGWGEATPFPVITGSDQARVMTDLGAFAPRLRGKGAKAVDPLALLETSRICREARQALDVALHDRAARERGVPLATYLGGPPRRLPTSVTVPLVEPADLRGRVEAALEQGFRILKVKSKAGAEEEAARIRAVRDLVGSRVELRVDANGGWSRAEAHALLPVLRRADVAFLEQPLARDDLDGHAGLVRERSVPIMLDESVFTVRDAERAFAAGALDMINIKLAKTGGIREAHRIAQFAAEHGIPCMVGCMIQTRMATTADAHFAAAEPAVWYVDLDGHTFLTEDPAVGGVRIQRGAIEFPDAPGLGAHVPLEEPAPPAVEA